ncbi:MAG: hypothetical protein H6728_12775 [Myxococcales bacterium]|nr:hypothetical protein [Myxococcales bacterium]
MFSVLLQACGEPSVCQNDQQCTGERICLYGKCVDASEKPKEASTAEPKPEATVEVTPESTPEAGPEEALKETSPEIVAEAEPPGLRKEGQTCDPRRLAWWYDRCAPGLDCAETRQTTPEDGAPQPLGVCLKGCTQDNPTCPAGTRCAQTYDTKTRQGTGIYVCAKEVGDGGACANTQTCSDGLTCMRYGSTGIYWRCQKACDADPSVCGTGKNCEALSSEDPTKACKTARKIGELCVSEDSCESGAGCVPSQLVGAPGRCLKKCGTQSDCAADEVCRGFNGGGVIGVFCFKASARGEACLAGKQCKENSDVCAPDNPNYPLAALCLKRCTTDNDCVAGQRCDVVSGSVRACKTAVLGGSVLDGMSACATGSRPLQISSGSPALCLPDCSFGTSTASRLCGVLSAGTLYDLVWLDAQKVLVTGPLGEILVSGDAGANWVRLASPRSTTYRGIAAAKAGKLVLAVGDGGVLVRSEDSGATWTQVFSSELGDINLQSVAISEDGTQAVILGAGQKAFRSADEGKTWQAISFSGLATGAELSVVAVGADKGTTPSPKWMIVGTAATILQSTDAGQTWTPVTVAGVTEDLADVALARDAAATGITGVIAGKSALLLSTTDGQTWKKETVTETTDFLAVAVEAGKAYAAGTSGIVMREDAGVWSKVGFPENRSLYGLAANGANVLATGEGGSVFVSRDDGKTWTAFTTQNSRCVGLTSQGNPAGGVCLFLCDPTQRGKDCPPELSNCTAVTIGTSSVNICQPNASLNIPGSAKEGDACDSIARANDNKRCADGLRCLNAQDGSGSRCVRPCDLSNPSCEGGKTCLQIGSSSFCGTAANKDAGCNAADALFCSQGLSCQRNTDAKFICQEDPIKQVNSYEACDSSVNRCPINHICLGASATPYRAFCSPGCTPGATPSGCPDGWECFSLTSGEGACLERCPSADYTCTAKFLTCQTISSRGGQHCY